MKLKLIYLFLIFISVCQYSFGIQNSNLEQDLASKYLYLKMEERFPNENIQFKIEDRKIIVLVYPEDPFIKNQIESFLSGISGADSVIFDSTYVVSEECQPAVNLETISLEQANIIQPVIEEGEWLPELNPFFPTLLAQPHIVGYSAGYRTYDKVFKTDCLPVSIGDQFSLYQFKNIRGQLYFGVEACVWAIFEAKSKSLALINADYFIALPLTYINDRFAARLRVFHESSHLGDEILLENKSIKRLNPSMEVVDLFLSYDLTNSFTLFGGFSHVLRSDDSYKVKPKGFYYGFNFYLDVFKLKICNLEARPYVATYFNQLEENKWKVNTFVSFGYQWDKLYGHKFRIYLEGHEGYSQEGQFSKKKTRYLALKFLYGY